MCFTHTLNWGGGGARPPPKKTNLGGFRGQFTKLPPVPTLLDTKKSDHPYPI